MCLPLHGRGLSQVAAELPSGKHCGRGAGRELAVVGPVKRGGVAFAEHPARERLLKSKPTQSPDPALAFEWVPA